MLTVVMAQLSSESNDAVCYVRPVLCLPGNLSPLIKANALICWVLGGIMHNNRGGGQAHLLLQGVMRVKLQLHIVANYHLTIDTTCTCSFQFLQWSRNAIQSRRLCWLTWCRHWCRCPAVFGGDLLSRPCSLSILSFLSLWLHAGDTHLFILLLSQQLPCFLFWQSVTSRLQNARLAPLDSSAVLLDCFPLVEVEAVSTSWLEFLSERTFTGLLIVDCFDVGLLRLRGLTESLSSVFPASDRLERLTRVLAAARVVFNCGSGAFVERLWK